MLKVKDKEEIILVSVEYFDHIVSTWKCFFKTPTTFTARSKALKV